MKRGYWSHLIAAAGGVGLVLLATRGGVWLGVACALNGVGWLALSVLLDAASEFARELKRDCDSRDDEAAK